MKIASNTITPIKRARDHDDVGSVCAELPPLVAPGEYEMVLVSYRTSLAYGRAPKVALRFRIVTQGKYYGLEMERWYNVKRLIGNPRKGGKFQVGVHSDFLHEYVTLFANSWDRNDRISFKPFRNTIVTGRVETVKVNRDQKPKPQPLQYSVVRELLKAGT